jgi:hypothetical protein
VLGKWPRRLRLLRHQDGEHHHLIIVQVIWPHGELALCALHLARAVRVVILDFLARDVVIADELLLGRWWLLCLLHLDVRRQWFALDELVIAKEARATPQRFLHFETSKIFGGNEFRCATVKPRDQKDALLLSPKVTLVAALKCFESNSSAGVSVPSQGLTRATL